MTTHTPTHHRRIRRPQPSHGTIARRQRIPEAIARTITKTALANAQLEADARAAHALSSRPLGSPPRLRVSEEAHRA